MKTTLIFFVLLSVLYQPVALAQAADIAIDWGPLRKERDQNFNEIIGLDGDVFYTISSDEKGMFNRNSADDYVIKGIDIKTKAIKFSRVLNNFEFQGSKARYKKAYVRPGGGVVLYFDVYDGRNDKKMVIYRTMDEKGKFGPSELLETVEAYKRSEGGFQVFTSRDSTKLVVYSDVPTERNEQEEFRVKVMDRDHQIIWERSIILPYTDRYFTVLDQALSNKGELFILGFSEPDRKKGEKKERNASNEDYRMYRIYKDEAIVEFDLDLDDKYVNDASIHADYIENMVAIPGFYSDQYQGYMKGAFFITITQDELEPVTSSLQEFGKEFMMNFMSERKAEKGREISNFDFKHFISRTDGGAIVVAERNYVVVTSSYVNGVYTETRTYYSEDIIVINIDPDGNIEWSSVVPKKQRLGGPYYLSYLLMVDGTNVHFIYNDDSKNLPRYGTDDKLKYMSNVKKSSAIIATVDQDGSVTKDVLFHNKQFKALLVPKKSYQASKDKLILYAVRKDESRFGTVEMR